ncbi:MAG: hypothetical protein MZU84_08330 [Sphingobacterium sp.]|nr:hypothetical protein [Sphingobacterium sp.]
MTRLPRTESASGAGICEGFPTLKSATNADALGSGSHAARRAQSRPGSDAARRSRHRLGDRRHRRHQRGSADRYPLALLWDRSLSGVERHLVHGAATDVPERERLQRGHGHGLEDRRNGDFNGDQQTDILWRYYGTGPFIRD